MYVQSITNPTLVKASLISGYRRSAAHFSSTSGPHLPGSRTTLSALPTSAAHPSASRHRRQALANSGRTWGRTGPLTSDGLAVPRSASSYVPTARASYRCRAPLEPRALCSLNRRTGLLQHCGANVAQLGATTVGRLSLR